MIEHLKSLMKALEVGPQYGLISDVSPLGKLQKSLMDQFFNQLGYNAWNPVKEQLEFQLENRIISQLKDSFND